MRVTLHTRLRPGTEEAYEKAHQEVPAELLAAIRSAGVRDWTIWRSGLDLFHLIDCEDYGRLLDELRELDVNVAWQQRMDRYLDVAHDYTIAGTAAGLPVAWDLSASLDMLPGGVRQDER